MALTAHALSLLKDFSSKGHLGMSILHFNQLVEVVCGDCIKRQNPQANDGSLADFYYICRSLLAFGIIYKCMFALPSRHLQHCDANIWVFLLFAKYFSRKCVQCLIFNINLMFYAVVYNNVRAYIIIYSLFLVYIYLKYYISDYHIVIKYLMYYENIFMKIFCSFKKPFYICK